MAVEIHREHFLNAYPESYFRRLLLLGVWHALGTLDWRRCSDGGRHYNQYFLVLWLVATLVNMWLESLRRLLHQGEAPVALLVCSPAIVAIFIGEILHVLGWQAKRTNLLEVRVISFTDRRRSLLPHATTDSRVHSETAKETLALYQ